MRFAGSVGLRRGASEGRRGREAQVRLSDLLSILRREAETRH
jgi:hypothetical protein